MKKNTHDGKRFEGYYADYSEFLQSEFWQKIRTRFFKVSKRTIKVCFICGTKKDLQLHHKSYKKIRHNTTNNLICLCATHHHDLHFPNGIKKYPPERFNFYIEQAVIYAIENNTYPKHLSKYQKLIDKLFENK